MIPIDTLANNHLFTTIMNDKKFISSFYHYIKVIFILLLLPLFTSELQAQHALGDIEVPSFEYIFDSDNRDLWKEKNNRGLHEFKIQKSDIWNKEGYSRLYIKEEENSSATFMTEDKHEESFWSDKVVDPLVQQLGNYEKVKIQHPFVIGEGPEVSMLQWTYQEKGKEYRILFGDMGSLTGIIIYQQKDTSN